MIGAVNSPMSMFTGGGNEAFQRGMAIGNANSPFATVGDALKNVVDKYNSHINMQQEQQNKMDLLTHEYGLKHSMFGNTPDPDAAGPYTQLDPATGKSFYRSTTIDPTTGQQKVSWAPVSLNAPEDPVDAIVRKGLEAGKGNLNPIQQGAGASISTPAPVVTPTVNATSTKMPTKAEIANARAQGFKGYDTATGQWVK